MYVRLSKLSHVTFVGIPNMRGMLIIHVPGEDWAVHLDITSFLHHSLEPVLSSSNHAFGVIKVKVLGYSLHPVWYCSVDCTKYLRSLGWFIPDSTSTPQGAYSLADHWCTELINWQCHHYSHCPIFFLLLWYEGAVEMDLSKAPTMTDSARIRIRDPLIIGLKP